MSINFSAAPGMRERHLIRRYKNPLFQNNVVTAEDLLHAQQEDIQEAEEFMRDFHRLVQQAVALDDNADPDVVLKLKEQLDKSYETCAGLAGEQSELKDMLTRLIKAIMQAMWKGIGDDYMARSKLDMEEQARSAHFALLEHKIVVDIIRPDSVIKEDELAATLLSENIDSLKIALHIFQPEQQAMLCKLAGEVLDKLDRNNPLYSELHEKLVEMEKMLQASNEMPL